MYEEEKLEPETAGLLGANNIPRGIAPLRRRHRWTYVHFAIHLLCLIYWITGSIPYSPRIRAWSPETSMIQHNSSLQVTCQSNATTTLPASPRTGDGEEDIVSEDEDDLLASEPERIRDPVLVATGTRKYPPRFPRQIWQTASEEGRTKWGKLSQTWQGLEGWQYNFLNDDDADEFVRSHFNETSPAIVYFWDSLMIPALRADYLRYLIMLVSGGIYADIDTDVLISPDQWIPYKYSEQKVNAIVGIEYDDNTYPLFVRPISFSQWTLMSKPGHPIFEIAVQRMMSNLEFMARRDRVDFVDLVPTPADVLQGTGPCMITDVVMQVIRDQGYDLEWATFHNQKEAILFGDVLVLPINAFAGRQKHSNSGKPEYGQKFVGHHLGHSWYTEGRDRLDV